MVWSQVYNPLSNAWLSTLVAALPIVVLLGALGIFRIKAHYAAILGLTVSLLVAAISMACPQMAGRPPCLAPPSACCRSAGSF